MANKMLIDATHPEETRVVVLRGNRVEEFDFESASRKQLRGNIYLAKVTRVEPSLQAAFVDYGGNRHGFLAFSEIHPDYYQIPVADRQALLDEEQRAHRAADDEDDRRARHGRGRRERPSHRRRDEVKSDPASGEQPTEHPVAREFGGDESVAQIPHQVAQQDTAQEDTGHHGAAPSEPSEAQHGEAEPGVVGAFDALHAEPTSVAQPAVEHDAPSEAHGHDETDQNAEPAAQASEYAAQSEESSGADDHRDDDHGDGNGNVVEVNSDGGEGEDVVESVGGSDAMEEMSERMPRSRRQYKIQEVIKRRQVMLVQVVKEERGTKGAALTTYLSLAGRYSVLMPNTARGGGISRKITDSSDRGRLKEVAQELDVPEGMGVILRTAGASRTKTEIKRDFEYLLRLWETVRDLTLKSTAPTLVYEEGSLVKRSIRDLYNKDIDEVVVAGDAAYREAKDFMRMLQPSHAKNVKAYHGLEPLFTHFGIETQLDAMFQPIVQLRSGGYIVINQAEALVAIDVNSGRATREHHIEDTALKTNSEAAEEIARQLRLRDLAGLIVIDFIDMDEKRNNRSVERRLKECLRHDRARIQVGHISHFGLLEMSRQRIRSSVLESSTEKCPYCGGTGHVRSIASVALQLLRTLDETLLKGATHNLIVRTRADIALYVLNHKRAHLRTLEQRFELTISINADPTIAGQQTFVVEKGDLVHTVEQARAIAARPTNALPILEEEEDEQDYIEADIEEAEEDEEPEVMAEPESDEDFEAPAIAESRPEGERNGRKRRRRRGRRDERPENGRAPNGHAAAPIQAQDSAQNTAHHDSAFESEGDEAAEPNGDAGPDMPAEQNGEAGPRPDGERPRRRRGRRGGRRNRRTGAEGELERPVQAGEFGNDEHEGDVAVEDADVPTQVHMAETIAAYAPQPALPVEPVRVQRDEHVSAPVPSAQRPVAQEPAAPEPPRRRSTIREPAPTFRSVSPAPAPTPIVVSTPAPEPEPAPAQADTPRRAGWWSRKVFGRE